MVCPEKTVFEKRSVWKKPFFFHSEGLLSRQFIFQSLTESHKVPLLLVLRELLAGTAGAAGAFAAVVLLVLLLLWYCWC